MRDEVLKRSIQEACKLFFVRTIYVNHFVLIGFFAVANKKELHKPAEKKHSFAAGRSAKCMGYVFNFICTLFCQRLQHRVVRARHEGTCSQHSQFGQLYKCHIK